MRRALLAGFVVSVLLGCEGQPIGTGTPSAPVVPRAPADPAATTDGEQILFGDLHVHTSYSADAFVMNLPMMGGDGIHPPADACDYARYCAELDFWSINDHAENLTPTHWAETVESVRECNALAGDPASPDMVTFLGWEWTQVGTTPETHYGHKNVVLRDTEEDRVPARAIAAPRPEFRATTFPPVARALLPLLAFSQRQEYFDYYRYAEEVNAVPLCPAGVPVRELPADCQEVAHDPTELFAKLDDWGREYLVIPHGTTWGLSTPPLGSWEYQASKFPAASRRQSLIEVYSGHGNSEEYRPFQSLQLVDGKATCPAPTDDYEACCWRAGEIIRGRCEDPGSDACEALVAKARSDHAASGVAAHRSIPGVEPEEWLDCGQCRDCTGPSYDYRPRMSAQYALASGSFRFGFIGSSDTHTARAGNGYKEKNRRKVTDAMGSVSEMSRRMTGDRREPTAESSVVNVDEVRLQALRYTERGFSMLLSGGLVAVHAEGRNADGIWDALDRREAYATSGDRMLLWFDLLNAPGGSAPMGADVRGQAEAPRFRARAVGAFEQRDGCPDYSVRALTPERLERLCLGECHHPGDRRRLVTRIEVVRITPRASPDESIDGLVEDPWRVFECAPDPAGCVVEFEDADFAAGGREVSYYVRAVQEPTPAINGQGLRCEYDDAGRCVRARPCYPGVGTPLEDDCLGEFEERAWASPIFVSGGAAPRVP